MNIEDLDICTSLKDYQALKDRTESVINQRYLESGQPQGVVIKVKKEYQTQLNFAGKNHPIDTEVWIGASRKSGQRELWQDGFGGKSATQSLSTKVYGVNRTVKFEVDHIHGRARADEIGWGYLRLSLIPRAANHNDGILYQKAMTKDARNNQSTLKDINQARDQRMIVLQELIKTAGFIISPRLSMNSSNSPRMYWQGFNHMCMIPKDLLSRLLYASLMGQWNTSLIRFLYTFWLNPELDKQVLARRIQDLTMENLFRV